MCQTFCLLKSFTVVGHHSLSIWHISPGLLCGCSTRHSLIFRIFVVLFVLLDLYVWGCQGYHHDRRPVGFPWNGKIPYLHQATWSQPINMCPVRKRESGESWKARECPSLKKGLWKLGPIKLLCKHVTNPLKPATNCLCPPYKFV